MADAYGFYAALGVRLPHRRGEWVRVRCFLPDHRDRHASASVNVDHGGWRCFSCGSKGGAYQAALQLGLRPGDAAELVKDHGLWMDGNGNGRRWPKPPTTAAAPTVPEPVEEDALLLLRPPAERQRLEHEYQDEHGEPLYRTVRVELDNGDKKIWQERRDGVDWRPGLRDTRRVLYRLPQVIEQARAGVVVYLLEGEKGCDLLEQRGLVATTSPLGAGKWSDDYAPYLMRAEVVLCPDCDQAGRGHMYAAGTSLLAHGAQLYLLELDIERQDGYDVADHLATSGLPDAQPVDARALDEWRQRWLFHANPAGRVLLDCERCGRLRAHRLKAGIAYCDCGGHTVP